MGCPFPDPRAGNPTLQRRVPGFRKALLTTIIAENHEQSKPV
jgi:hypothetical protein